MIMIVIKASWVFSPDQSSKGVIWPCFRSSQVENIYQGMATPLLPHRSLSLNVKCIEMKRKFDVNISGNDDDDDDDYG